MSCKSLCQLRGLGTNSFRFKINKRTLGSAQPTGGTLGTRKLSEVLPLQRADHSSKATTCLLHPLFLKSWLQTWERAKDSLEIKQHSFCDLPIQNDNTKAWMTLIIAANTGIFEAVLSSVAVVDFGRGWSPWHSVFLIYKGNGCLGIDHWPKASC